MTFHVEYPRTVPARRPEGHQPAAPRYTLRWDKPVGELISAYFAMQGHGLPPERQAGFLERLTTGFGEADGPAAHEVMRFVDEAGETNAVAVGYWTDTTAYARWSRGSTVARWLADDARLAEPGIGYWREAIAVPYDRHETIYSAPGYRIGLARTAGAAIVAMTTNGYFGAARDRIPLSAIDALESPLAAAPPEARPVASRGKRLTAATPHNMCVLRSGQFWEDAGPEQLGDYRENLEPKLMRGMDYLAGHKGDTGTLALRVMTNIDADGAGRAETSVLAYFLALEQLEAWARSHQTHLDIYHHAIAMNRKFKAKREVVTWHELFVMPAAASFEYVNCHPRTGVLPYCSLFEAAR
ncbi:phenylacetaldoxime dehydratase family protein [Chelatococcus reniformis]|uniref:Phenylacetaldoxime dehydratase n=1 Tax=Chelatococcus reniformis TaxID=1494448 RepID=A0A916TXN0_9HYPH|nr:phenylacetaldoxime dehydratase family protein [Chelatococcus reniformis]GGC48956.1 phenylacetaldoxime dehydratase [Chelatococcus reniformis]